MSGNEPPPTSDEEETETASGDEEDDAPNGDDQYVIREARDATTYAENQGAVERDDGYTIDPIGVGIAAVIVVVAIVLLYVGPLSTAMAAPPAPNADWRVSRVNASYVQVAHVGGDEVSAANLVLTVNGTERDPGWPATVSQGEVVLVRAERPSQVTVTWTGGDEPERLARWDV